MRYLYLALGAFFVLTASAAQAQSIACSGGQAGAYSCENVDMLAHIPQSEFGASRNNDLWGWTDPETSRKYALVGTTNGVVFVDVTVADAPVYLGKLPTQTQASTWRDVKTYGDYAYIVADGAGDHGMQVFDLKHLRNVTSPPVTFSADVIYTSVGSAHNVVINPETPYIYIVGSSGSTSCSGGGLHIVDISSHPLDPQFEGCFDDDGYTHDAQCTIYNGPDTDYTGREICALGQGTFGPDSHVSFVDVTDKSNPVLISQGFYTNAVYTHQGWFTEDQRYFLVNDEIDDDASGATRTIVMDVEDLDSPELAFFYLGVLETTDHNLYVRDQYAYLSNYEGGLRVLDLSGIGNGILTEVAHFDTYPASNNESYNGQWSNYPYFENGPLIANDRDEGLFILGYAPMGTANAPTATPAPGVALSEPVPNPARDQATLIFTSERPQQITAEVFDITGRRVATLYEGSVGTAPLTLTVDGSNLPSGLYLVQVRGEHFFATRRVSLVQ